ncbi:iron transport multicopper oxidase [Entomortierella parvispora]|uniref:Iron transport multicopper oxidase n=1 Tax=Entomortierella parvispora TaxID=205924 RepID=A0A9P3HBJ2_9FUNG|nr:iron transport multicopper oxidase [Entomortierella parvispora]
MLPSFKTFAAALTLLSAAAQAAVVTYNWNITYVNANPDGLYERRVIGVNGVFPPPPIEVTVNDTLVINAINQLDVPTSLHAHGLFQVGNNQMDGPSMVTQCPFPPGANFTYTIPTVNQTGTYWIHGHNLGQYVDGLRAPLIIHAINETYTYDEEYTVAFADWYHQEHAPLLAFYLSIYNPSGAEPIPQSGLINQMTNATFAFVPGKTYRLRVINMSALSIFHFHIDGHEFDIIEVDGIDVQKANVTTFPIAAAQRYSVLVTAKNSTSNNYLIHGDMDPMMYDVVPPNLVLNITGTIVYAPDAPLAPIEYSDWAAFEDATLVPVLAQPTSPYTTQNVLTAAFYLMTDYTNKAVFNDITYVMPKVPSLYTALSMGNLSSNPQVYGPNAHALIASHNEWFEIVINNDDTGNHPFHLHGHVFQIVGRSEGLYDGSTPYPYYDASTNPNYANPMRRDTMLVPAGTNAAIRFQANNPGVWFFHCHIEWHLEAGLAITLIEAPEVMPSVLTVDPQHYEQCAVQGIPYQGNAAGNAGLNLTGANFGPSILPGKFTAKGIVALVFTIIAALLGLVTVVWYAHDDDLALAQASLAEAAEKNKAAAESEELSSL